MIVTDEDLDLSMREADVAIRTRKPTQPDLIQRKLFSIGIHAYCSPEYIKRFGTPRTLDDLDDHRIIMLSDPQVQPHLQNRSWLIDAGRNGSGPREAFFRVNNILGLVRACQQGLGIAALPDYLIEENTRLVQLFGESDSIQLDTYFVYPEELKTVARVQVFRDFVVSKAQRWPS
jgi:DNA-binding transcriptional LysR family regulator